MSKAIKILLIEDDANLADNTGCLIEHFGNADAVPQPPERCLSVRRELCGVALTLYWFPWRGAGRDAA